MYKLSEKIPDKGKDLVVIDSDGNKNWCYRCACKSENCVTLDVQ